MQVSKENVFKINYSSVVTKKKRTSKIINFIKNNKIISMAVSVFVLCVSINIFFIYSFIRIVEKL